MSQYRTQSIYATGKFLEIDAIVKAGGHYDRDIYLLARQIAQAEKGSIT